MLGIHRAPNHEAYLGKEGVMWLLLGAESRKETLDSLHPRGRLLLLPSEEGLVIPGVEGT